MALAAEAPSAVPAAGWPVADIADQLTEHGWWVGAAPLIEPELDALRRDAVATIRATGYQAGVGHALLHRVEPGLRGDRIAWITATSEGPLGRWLQLLDVLREGLRTSLRLPLQEIEALTARYPRGTGYARHIDQHRGVESRLVSCVLYLNADWQTDDGGQLCLWPPATEPVEVTPLAGRVVVFRADLPHAVAITRRSRYSVTAWLRRGTAP